MGCSGSQTEANAHQLLSTGRFRGLDHRSNELGCAPFEETMSDMARAGLSLSGQAEEFEEVVAPQPPKKTAFLAFSDTDSEDDEKTEENGELASLVAEEIAGDVPVAENLWNAPMTESVTGNSTKKSKKKKKKKKKKTTAVPLVDDIDALLDEAMQIAQAAQPNGAGIGSSNNNKNVDDEASKKRAELKAKLKNKTRSNTKAKVGGAAAFVASENGTFYTGDLSKHQGDVKGESAKDAFKYDTNIKSGAMQGEFGAKKFIKP